jgi:hypothetical protein
MFNPLDFANRLKDAGMEPKQADVYAELFYCALDERELILGKLNMIIRLLEKVVENDANARTETKAS